MTLEEYAVEKLKNLETDNLFLRNQVENTIEELREMRSSYGELKDFIKKHVQECTAATGYKIDKYFWENDPEYDLVASLVNEDKPF